MKVSLGDFDFWLIRGLSGIVNLLTSRIKDVKHGFDPRVQQYSKLEVLRLMELDSTVQSWTEEAKPENKATINSIDNWFILGFVAMDKFLKTRADEGPVPIDEPLLQSIQDHITRLEAVIRGEREKCKSSGSSALGDTLKLPAEQSTLQIPPSLSTDSSSS